MLEVQHENFVAAVRKRELLVATTTMKVRGSEKKSELEHVVRHFLHKTCNLGRFWKFHVVVVTGVNNGKGIINI